MLVIMLHFHFFLVVENPRMEKGISFLIPIKTTRIPYKILSIHG